MPTDGVHMRRALELAQARRGRTWPNPTVGCVLVKDGVVMGEGAHEGPGSPHAEVVALSQAGSSARGATAYITLEPCCHWGRTPPCTDALLEAGVVRVVAAMVDPNPRVAGSGLSTLRDRGLDVSEGLMSGEAAEMNEGFIKHICTGMPFVTAKWAMTLDGRVASVSGDSKWVTSDAARADARGARAQHGAVLVGVGTVLADDPTLGAPEGITRPLHRIVLDTSLRIPLGARILSTPGLGPVLLFCGRDAAPARERALSDSGAHVIRLEHPTQPDPARVLEYLGHLGLTAVFVEGGSAVLGSFFNSGLVDRVMAYIAPSVLTGGDALSPLGGVGPPLMRQALRLSGPRWESVGCDIVVTGLVRKGGADPCSQG